MNHIKYLLSTKSGMETHTQKHSEMRYSLQIICTKVVGLVTNDLINDFKVVLNDR